MCNHALIHTIPRQHHAIWSRRLPIILAPVRQHRELVVRPCVGKGEALVVEELVGVFVAAGGGAGLQVGAGSLDSGVEIGLGVAGVAACIRALARGEGKKGGGEGGGGKEG